MVYHPTRPEPPKAELPDGTEHVIVTDTHHGITGNSPEDYDGPDRIVYERGDELPAAMARSCYDSFPEKVMVLDADEESIHTPTEMKPEIADVIINRWRDDGFKP